MIMIIILLLSYSIESFISNNVISKVKLCSSKTNNNVEDGVNLLCLNDIQSDSIWLANSIEKWLNEEFIPLKIHNDISNIIKLVYIDARSKHNINDLGELLMEIGTKLETIDISDTFVNAWDIANKASDLLMIRMNRELCSCAGDLSNFTTDNEIMVTVKSSSTSINTIQLPIINENIDIKRLNKISNKLSAEFNRLTFIREFLEDEIDIDDMNIVIAIVLGFRLNNDNKLVQNNDYAPIGWTDMNAIPDLFNNSSLIDTRLINDMPDETEATDIVIESIIGAEMLKIMNTQNDIIKRKILITKWLYVHGFLTFTDFPIKRKIDYFPEHLTQNDDE